MCVALGDLEASPRATAGNRANHNTAKTRHKAQHQHCNQESSQLSSTSIACLVCLDLSGTIVGEKERKGWNHWEQNLSPAPRWTLLTTLLVGLLACASICCQYFLDSCTISSWVIPGNKRKTELSNTPLAKRREGGVADFLVWA